MKPKFPWRYSYVMAMGLLCHVSPQTPPVLTIPPGGSSVTLLETTSQPIELVTGIACSDVDGDTTRIIASSVSPTFPCGECFALYPTCAPSTEHCLVYNTGQGQLSQASASTYYVQLECTDVDGTDIAVIEVHVTGNTPPSLVTPVVSKIRQSVFIRLGNDLFQVESTDVEQDFRFYSLDTDQPELFEIGYADGVIRTANDLRFQCDANANMAVSVKDPYNTAIGPFDLSLQFGGRNIQPVILNTDTVVQIDEDSDDAALTLDRTVLALTILDLTLYKSLIYRLRAIPETGLQYYYLDQSNTNSPTIRTRSKLNYEYEPSRTTELCVDAMDGFCAAETYCVMVEVININESPDLGMSRERKVYEGFIDLDLGWSHNDPDIDEVITWQLFRSQGLYDVDQDKGHIHSIGEIDIDPNTISQMLAITAMASDDEGLSSQANIRLIVCDKNDNAPYFPSRTYTVSATECSQLGSTLMELVATDDDSEFQGNDMLHYSGSGPFLSVLSTGAVTLTSACTTGDAGTTSAHVSDQGEYPGPLSGIPTTLIFTCGPCPTPVPTVTTQSTISPLTVETDFVGTNLGWIIVAALLGTILVGLLTYMLLRFCRRCWSTKTSSRQKTDPSSKLRASTPAVNTKKLPQEEQAAKPDMPPPPPTLPPNDDSHLFPFWKETYGERDQRHFLPHDRTPASVEEDKKIEEKEQKETELEEQKRTQERRKLEENHQKLLKKYHKQIEKSNNATPKKRSLCIII